MSERPYIRGPTFTGRGSGQSNSVMSNRSLVYALLNLLGFLRRSADSHYVKNNKHSGFWGGSNSACHCATQGGSTCVGTNGPAEGDHA
jgi:hypothetical protein